MRFTNVVLLLLLCRGVFAEATDPRAVAERFFEAWRAGDVAKAATYWTAATSPDFTRRVRRPLESSCITVHELRVTDVREAEVFAEIRLTRLSTMPGAREQHDILRPVLRLERVGGEWRIASWREAEDQWVEARQPRAELWNHAYVRALGRRAVDAANRDARALAQELASEGLRVADFIGDESARSYALSAASAVARTKNPPDVAASIEFAKQAVEAAERSGDPNALAGALFRLARMTFVSGGDPALFRRVLALAPYIDEDSVVAMAASQVATGAQADGEYRVALEYATMTARHAEISGLPSAMVSAEIVFGNVYRSLGDAELAALHYDRAIALARKAGMGVVYTSLVQDLVTAKIAAGHPSAALMRTIDEALAVPSVRERNSLTSALLAARARVRLALGQLDDAEADLGDAIALAGAENTAAYLTLGELLLARGDAKRATTAFDLGPKVRDMPQWVSNVAAVRRTADVDEAIDFAQCMIEYSESVFERMPAAERQQQTYLANHYAIEQILVELLVEKRRTRDALDVAEAAKARVLRDVAGRTRRPANVKSPEAAREQDLLRRIESLNQSVLREQNAAKLRKLREELSVARLELDDVRARLVAGAELYASASRATRVSWPYRGVTALQYMVGDDRTVIFAVRADAAGAMQVDVDVLKVKRTELASLVRQFRERVAARDLRHREPARKLYDLLIAPAHESLAGATSICVVPDGDLWKVPFQALTARNGRALVERAAVFYAPSIQMLNMVHRHRPVRASRLLALGNPFVSTANRQRAAERAAILGDLVEAEAEVRAIARLYGADRSSVYIGREAREAVFKEKAPQYDVLHVASHGLVDDAAPRFSALVLASRDGDAEDGLLEAHEVAALKLDADLVVLSACDTAGGRVGAGEGILGLAWAFLAAGAHTLVGSQWKAPSAATEVLMRRFHERLVAGDAPAEALRQAQLRLMGEERYSAPLDWAAFVVVGDGL